MTSASEAIQVRERGEKMDGCRQDALNLRKSSLAFQVPSQTLWSRGMQGGKRTSNNRNGADENPLCPNRTESLDL